jgi:outer membrane receptor for ferrienterochelin and colicins
LYATYAINDSWTVKGGVSTGYKTPKTSDLQEGIVGFGGQGTSPKVGNPDLKPEKSISKEVAVYYEHPNKHNFNVTLFQNNFKDKIDTGTATQSAGAEWESINSDYGEIKQKQNVGKAEILGLEASAKFYILDSLSIKGNWTWMDSKINSDKADTNGRPLQDSPEHMYSTTLDWQATSKLNTYIQYSGEINRFNQRYETTGSSNDADKRYKDSYYKDYSIVNLGASYKFTKDFTLTGRVNNLLDKDFLEYNYVESVINPSGRGSTTHYYDEYNNKTSGRNFWVSARYTF